MILRPVLELKRQWQASHDAKGGSSMNKVLVAYFSATGTTKKKAEQIAQAAGADLFEIAPAEPYTSADLDWTDKKSRSTIEMQNTAFRPELKEDVPDLAPYDKIVIGFPIWWYTAPRIINTFLDSGEFIGKKVYLFATSGGSGIDRTIRDLRANYTNIHFVSGRMMNGTVNPVEIRAWLS